MKNFKLKNTNFWFLILFQKSSLFLYKSWFSTTSLNIGQYRIHFKVECLYEFEAKCHLLTPRKSILQVYRSYGRFVLVTIRFNNTMQVRVPETYILVLTLLQRKNIQLGQINMVVLFWYRVFLNFLFIFIFLLIKCRAFICKNIVYLLSQS